MNEDEDYALELALDAFYWVLLLPAAITANSHKKWVRVTGVLLVFPFVITGIVTAIPVLLFAMGCVMYQMIKDA